MALVIKGSSSGQVTVDVPAAAGTNTLTIPASTGEMLTTVNPKAGNVIQVVQERTKTLFTTTSGTMADIGLSAAITPSSSSSKVLVVCNINGIFFSAVAGSYASIILLRGSTNVTGDAAAPYLGYPFGFNGAAVGRSSAQTMSYLDSPSTTDATTYKVQAAQVGGVTINFQRDAQVYSTIQLMEIAG